MRDGAEFFTQPANAAQRRYEALRAYFVDEASAVEVADRFGYSAASVHQFASLLRSGRMEFFADTKPGTTVRVSHSDVARPRLVGVRD
jgi:hypothetical protein